MLMTKQIAAREADQLVQVQGKSLNFLPLKINLKLIFLDVGLKAPLWVRSLLSPLKRLQWRTNLCRRNIRSTSVQCLRKRQTTTRFDSMASAVVSHQSFKRKEINDNPRIILHIYTNTHALSNKSLENH